MIPANLTAFMVACLGASASFIGLLFVGLSVVMQKGDQKLANKDRILAESSYASLVNIFFISLVGTLPNGGIGYVSLTMALIGLYSCWRLRKYSHTASLAASSIIYIVELCFAAELVTHSNRYVNLGIFQGIIIALFAISLVRAWNLTGVRANRDI
jgi:hypothetical protein